MSRQKHPTKEKWIYLDIDIQRATLHVEPHQVSTPEPSGTLRNLARNLALKLHRIAPELVWAKDPIDSVILMFCMYACIHTESYIYTYISYICVYIYIYHMYLYIYIYHIYICIYIYILRIVCNFSSVLCCPQSQAKRKSV